MPVAGEGLEAAVELECERLMERSALLLEEAGHRAEELSLERDRLRALVESMADEVWFCDAEGNLLAVNQAAAEGPGFPLGQRELFLGDESPDGHRESSEAATPPAGTMPILRSLRGETLRSMEHVVRHPRSGDAVTLRRRLAEGLETRNACGRYPYRLSVSVGIATYTPGSALSIEHLLARADADMYEQKRAWAEERRAGNEGRNRMDRMKKDRQDILHVSRKISCPSCFVP